MNSLQINKVLKKNSITKKCFRGVYSLDTLPIKKNIKKPAAFVVNTDPSNKPGTHWIAIYFPKNGCAEYYDSYGQWPPHKNFLNFIGKNNKKKKIVLHSKKKLQSHLSIVCGKYCCLYILCRCNGKSMKDFLKIYEGNTSLQNDFQTYVLFRKFFSIN